ncbi:MAG TPA: prepilin peptidase [Candidatus Humimicrobiaceae bacterium]|nr:prepilin peptidase [Candidatus Humimicrobiaceae bacterium]
MEILIYFSIFLFGLAVGSFLNCIIYRLETDQSFLKGRSFCPHCRHTLSWQDLIPLLSFFILRGKCRYCQRPISFQYPLVELATGLVFVLIFNFQPIFSLSQFVSTLYLFIISCLLIIIFVYDLKHYIIPDKVVYPAISIALIYSLQLLISKQFPTFNYLILSAIGAAAFFLAIVLISRGKWMGVGDIKLAFLMGLVLGWPNIAIALFSAFLIGAIIGIVLIILAKKTFKSEVPFGPFLVTGTFLALFWGQEIINFYVQSFYLGAF